MERMEDEISNVAGAKFQAVVALQLMAINLFAIDECSVLAAIVDDEKLAVLGNDGSMLARDPGIGDDEIAIDFAATV